MSPSRGPVHATGANPNEPTVLAAISRHRALIVICALVVAAAAFTIVSLRPKSYTAEANVLLENPFSATLARPPSARDEVRYVADQVAIMKSPALMQRASDLTQTGSQSAPIDSSDLRRDTTVRTTEGSSFVTILVTAGDRGTARIGADAIVRAYRAFVTESIANETTQTLRKLDLAIAGESRASANGAASAALAELRAARADVVAGARLAGDGVSLYSPAQVSGPRSTSRLTIVVAALVLGGLIGLGIAYVIDARRRQFTHDPHARAAFGTPILSEIPDLRSEDAKSMLPALDEPGNAVAAAFGSLAAAIALRQRRLVEVSSSDDEGRGRAEPAVPRQRKPVVISRVPARLDPVVADVDPGAPTPVDAAAASLGPVAFVSAVSGRGTTTVAANAAISAAQTGERVLMLDGDLAARGLTRLVSGARRGHTVLGNGAGAGLGDMLVRGLVPDGMRPTLETVTGGSVTLVEAGPRALGRTGASPSDLFRAGLVPMRERYDWVVIDAPPVLEAPFADALLMAAGAVVVVVRHGDDVELLERVLDHLALLDVVPLGLVRTFVPRRAATQPHPGGIADRVGELASMLGRSPSEPEHDDGSQDATNGGSPNGERLPRQSPRPGLAGTAGASSTRRIRDAS